MLTDRIMEGRLENHMTWMDTDATDRVFRGPGSLEVYVPPKPPPSPEDHKRDFPPGDPPEVRYLDVTANYWRVLHEAPFMSGVHVFNREQVAWLRSIESDVEALLLGRVTSKPIDWYGPKDTPRAIETAYALAAGERRVIRARNEPRRHPELPTCDPADAVLQAVADDLSEPTFCREKIASDRVRITRMR